MEAVFTDYIKSELLILIPVLFAIGRIMKSTQVIKDKWIPALLGGISVALCLIWVFATSDISGARSVLLAIFTAITQGVLLSATAVYTHQLIKQGSSDE